jgi:hypothetical protein
MKTKSLDVLDLCSSWISHFAKKGCELWKSCGVGMNEKRVRNQQAADRP